MSQIDKEQALRYAELEADNRSLTRALEAEIANTNRLASAAREHTQTIPEGHIVVPAALIAAIRKLMYAAFLGEPLDDHADAVNQILDAMPKERP